MSLQKDPRTGIYYFRKVIPEGLRPFFGRREFKESLRTRNPMEARALLPSSRWMRFSTTQEIALPEPGFCWRARVGPFGAIRVVDELDHGMPAGSVSLFDRIRLAQSIFSPALLKGELMRYLAELAWAPDAMIVNDSLRWEMIRSDRIAVSADCGPVSARVVMSIDQLGRITGIDAADRPRLENGHFVERPWRGEFGTYRSISGRLIPHQAEVSWQGDEHFEPVWIGELTSWRLHWLILKTSG